MQCSEPWLSISCRRSHLQQWNDLVSCWELFIKLDEKGALYEVQTHRPESANYSMLVSSVYLPNLKLRSLDTSGRITAQNVA